MFRPFHATKDISCPETHATSVTINGVCEIKFSCQLLIFPENYVLVTRMNIMNCIATDAYIEMKAIIF
jgi:uncharacterized membrane protein